MDNDKGIFMLEVTSGWLPEWLGGTPTTPDPIADLRWASDAINNAISRLSEINAGQTPMPQRIQAVDQAISKFMEQWQGYKSQQGNNDNAQSNQPTTQL